MIGKDVGAQVVLGGAAVVEAAQWAVLQPQSWRFGKMGLRARWRSLAAAHHSILPNVVVETQTP